MTSKEQEVTSGSTCESTIEHSYRNMSDEELLAAFQSGNHAAYGALVRRYKDPITNFAYRFLGSYDDAVDIAQETFIRVFRFAGSFVGDVKFSTWLYTIASNLCKSELKRYRRRFGVLLKDAFGVGKSDDDQSWDVPDSTYMPDENIDRDTIAQAVQRALMNISPTYREMIVLRDVQQLTYQEIALIMECELGTVKSRINRGRLQMKEQLQGLYSELFPELES